MMPYAGTDDLESAIARVGCGCELARRAEDPNADPTQAEADALEAPIAQEKLRCPLAGYELAHDVDDLCADAQDAIASAEALTGAECMTTCPLYYTRLPWAHRAARAFGWSEKGQLALVEPEPSSALVHALDLIATSVARRNKQTLERQKQEAESARERASRGGQ